LRGWGRKRGRGKERETKKTDLFGTIATNVDCAVNKPGGGCGGERLKGGDKNGNVPMMI
jgi:hypothetical protein